MLCRSCVTNVVLNSCRPTLADCCELDYTAVEMHGH